MYFLHRFKYSAQVNPFSVNQLLAGRDAAIATYEMGMAKALDTTELEAQQQELLSEMEVLNGMIQTDDPAERHGRAGPDRIQQAL